MKILENTLIEWEYEKRAVCRIADVKCLNYSNELLGVRS